MWSDSEQLPKLSKEGTERCYGCGQDNPIGLGLRFDYRDGTVVAEFTSNEYHQGWPGLVHGGILFTLLDEAMGHTFYAEGVSGVTAKAEVRFRRPAPLGETLVVYGSVVTRTSRLIESKATVVGRDGAVVAEARGLMYIVKESGEG